MQYKHEVINLNNYLLLNLQFKLDYGIEHVDEQF